MQYQYCSCVVDVAILRVLIVFTYYHTQDTEFYQMILFQLLTSVQSVA